MIRIRVNYGVDGECLEGWVEFNAYIDFEDFEAQYDVIEAEAWANVLAGIREQLEDIYGFEFTPEYFEEKSNGFIDKIWYEIEVVE